MNSENCLILETNGFVMNAGILGFLRLLEQIGATKGVDYDYNDYQLKIKKDYLLSLDLAQAYIETGNHLFYDTTHYAKIKKTLATLQPYQSWDECESTWTKEEKTTIQRHVNEVVKELDVLTNTKSLANACNWLKEEEGVADLLSLVGAIKKTTNYSEKIKQLSELETLLEIPKVKEVLCLVGISLKVLSHFWLNKAFIQKMQGNIIILSDRNMKLLLEESIIEPFKMQLTDLPTSDKLCLECGCKTKKTKPTTLSFMNDMADDVAKKPSAFWNFDKNQALLCDVCTFLYLLMPFGFTWMGRELVFVNANTTIESLRLTNSSFQTIEETQPLRWFAFYRQLIQQCLEKKILQSDNIQIIARTTEKGKQRYRFEVLSHDVLTLIHQNQNVLKGLSKCYSLKLSTGDYWNVYEEVISKLLNHSHLYPIMNQLLRLGVSPDYETSAKIQLPLIYQIQLSKKQTQLGGDYSMESKKLYFATQNAMKDGKALNHHLTYVSKKEIGSVMYRLLNALQTNNKYEFLNTVLRLHTSYKIKLSSDFMKLLNEDGYFKDMGYAYLLGLKGVNDFKDSTSEKGVDINDEK